VRSRHRPDSDGGRSGTLVATGVIDQVANLATATVGDKPLLASMVLLWVSEALSTLVDSRPGRSAESLSDGQHD
jgi:hypothetical protein